jgi:hypothetical protein
MALIILPETLRSMTIKDKHNNEDWEMLGHDPVPGYKTAFYIAVLVSVIYLAVAFFSGGSVPH